MKFLEQNEQFMINTKTLRITIFPAYIGCHRTKETWKLELNILCIFFFYLFRKRRRVWKFLYFLTIFNNSAKNMFLLHIYSTQATFLQCFQTCNLTECTRWHYSVCLFVFIYLFFSGFFFYSFFLFFFYFFYAEYTRNSTYIWYNEKSFVILVSIKHKEINIGTTTIYYTKTKV